MYFYEKTPVYLVKNALILYFQVIPNKLLDKSHIQNVYPKVQTTW